MAQRPSFPVHRGEHEARGAAGVYRDHRRRGRSAVAEGALDHHASGSRGPGRGGGLAVVAPAGQMAWRRFDPGNRALLAVGRGHGVGGAAVNLLHAVRPVWRDGYIAAQLLHSARRMTWIDVGGFALMISLLLTRLSAVGRSDDEADP